MIAFSDSVGGLAFVLVTVFTIPSKPGWESVAVLANRYDNFRDWSTKKEVMKVRTRLSGFKRRSSAYKHSERQQRAYQGRERENEYQ
jgi:hypothetical protein